MARVSTRQQILLLVAAASVPVSLGLTAWPPAHVHEIVVVQAVPVEAAAPKSEPIVGPPVEPAPAEPAEVELVEASAQPAGFVYGRDFLWVTDAEGIGQPFAVLSLEPDEAWAAGPVEVTAQVGLVTRAVAEDAVPAELRAMVGERVVIHGGGALLCTATVGPLGLVAQVEGDYEMFLDEGQLEDDESFWTQTDDQQREQVAKPAWESGRRLLVAPLVVDEACKEAEGPRWARPVRRGDPERLEAERLRRRPGLVSKFLALPELVELSQEFDDYVASMRQAELEEAAAAGAPAADPTALPALPRLADRVKGKQWRTAEGEVAFVTMITEGEELMPEPCSGIPVPAWAVAPVGTSGKTGSFAVGPDGTPSAILDLEGDGQWELLVAVDSYFTEPQLVTITPEGLETLTALPSVPFFGCPC